MSNKTSTKQPAKVSHIRRCHVCSGVCEAVEQAIYRCSHCGKHLAPFYYFDENAIEGVADNGLHFSLLKQAEQYNPIYGLSTYWQDSNDESDSRGYSQS